MSVVAVGKGFEGDIALDDISLNLGQCPPRDECDFEHGICAGWTRGPDGDFAWTRGRNGSTPNGKPTVGA